MSQILSTTKTTSSLFFKVTQTGTFPANTTAPSYTHTNSGATSPANGTAAGEVDLAHLVTEAVTDSNSLDIDLTTDTDEFGQALAMAKMRYLEIVSNQDVTLTSTVPFIADVLDVVTIKAGGTFILQDFNAGYVVTSTTADAITVTNNSGQTANISVRILGTSA